MVDDEMHDPLTINLCGQVRSLQELLPQDSAHHATLASVASHNDLLDALSRRLLTPGLTTAVAILFRPVLMDLTARWLMNDEELEAKLEACALLMEIHPELFPILNKLIQNERFAYGPLGFLQNVPSVASVEAGRLHRILLAYYRILHANNNIPQLRGWSLNHLSRIIWEPHPDAGARFLAIRCYALQSGMVEGERVKMEQDAVGNIEKTDCLIEYGAGVDGNCQVLDGWTVPAHEAQRVYEARQALMAPQKYYTYEAGDSIEPIHPAELSPLIADVHGILMLRSSNIQGSYSPLVSTPTTAQALRDIAINLSLNVPTLLTSPPSSGKSLLLTHLAALIYPDRANQIVTVHLADTSLDPRSLLGSYVSSPTRPGTFDWKDGVLVRAMQEGRWVVFEDIDRGSSEVLGLFKPLVESLGLDKWIGGQAQMEVPGRGTVWATQGFSIFATRSLQPSRPGHFASPTFFGAHKLFEIVVQSPSHDDLRKIVDMRFPRLAGSVGRALISLWETVQQVGSIASTRDVGVRELEKLCSRVDQLLPAAYLPVTSASDSEDGPPPTLASLFPNPTIREDIFFDCRDVFFGAGATTTAARAHVDTISITIAEHLGLSPDRRDWVLGGRAPEFVVDKDVNGSVTAVNFGRTKLLAAPIKVGVAIPITRSFAMHKPAVTLLSRIASAISLQEPILLTGETGTGKTSVVTHLASLLRKPLISLNLSNQTEASDIVGGFKPVDARVPAMELYERFLELFGGTFSRKKNAHFEDSVRKAVQEGKWKRAVALWMESARLAKERIQAKLSEDIQQSGETDAPRKRRKTGNEGLNVSESQWDEFEHDVRTFDVQHVQGNGKFAFAFVEGPLVKALRMGHWILLDEVNLASAETLECVSSLLHGPTASITLTEQGSLEPVPRHPEFRLFACMNPATDVGKKDLPPNIRSRFTELDVPPPDADKETLLSIVAHYIGSYAVGDKGAIMDVAEFYTAVRSLAEKREIADGSNHRPHYSMRTLARALTFAADLSNTYSLRRALWEGALMAFTMVLDAPSASKVTALAQKHILSGVRNPRSLLSKEPLPPQGRDPDDFAKFGPFYLERGPVPEDLMDGYIMTPSVETKLIDLARIVVTRRFPVLIEGPTSSGKTSSIEYLAKRTGHRFVRINNHEHTDIQEYLGTYVSDPATGKLMFKDGLLVRALRNGDWIVLDELNLAPTDVLEALNRLLDDNRELVIPETQEVVKPHPHFMLFATQNPPGLYGGRKVLSRAFRNRFLEVHFEDVPQTELETILCQRCRIAPSYGQKIVAVFQELQKRRQSSRIFESKHGFATLRDLFRWAGRDAIEYQELADNGYMLLAERARRDEDKQVVKEVIESIMKVTIDPIRLYALHESPVDLSAYLGCAVPESSELVWTSAMRRLFTLMTRALRFNEPVLLVGETGCGKTSVCQLFAQITERQLLSVNCHQNTETADLIGSLRPLRNRTTLEAAALSTGVEVLRSLGHATPANADVSAVTTLVDKVLPVIAAESPEYQKLVDASDKLHRLGALFEWHDGPLIQAMQSGDVFLMDEISLADDSVLERLNSVLEPGRTIVLAEQGGAQDLPAIVADANFKLVATMNPGGDYGKKELSPALRNRFTEIWVPAVEARQDLELIIRRTWQHTALEPLTGSMLDFTEWLSERVGDRSVVTLRDILALVGFINATYHPGKYDTLPLNSVFHHAAHMAFLDGLGSLPQLSAYSSAALKKIKDEAIARLDASFPLPTSYTDEMIVDDSSKIQLGSFSIPRGPLQPSHSPFSFEAPTTRDNVNRIVRACQLSKPILLEGSPGVGKTSIVAALANICGYQLCRINLSDQTDLVDLFGSDLPVEGGSVGQFAWKDAEFLRALQEGHWVLLDEMNLAPQAILEGLNAVLDHRGTVYIPELGRSFVRHPSFRIFAAQNPLQQGGGRKGLPKSFLNRFTKVYVQELSKEDTLLICRNLFPTISTEILQGMINYTNQLNEEAMVKRTFAREGAPWEFNLRDVLRWGSLIQQSGPSLPHPSAFVDILFLQRFRTPSDKDYARALLDIAFPRGGESLPHAHPITISPNHVQLGRNVVARQGHTSGRRPGHVLISQHSPLQALAACINNRWLAILTGRHDSGKNAMVRLMAHLTGNILQEIHINSATDATDILGSFEEVDARAQIETLLRSIIPLLEELSAQTRGSRIACISDTAEIIRNLLCKWSDHLSTVLTTKLSVLQTALDDAGLATTPLTALLQSILSLSASTVKFQWVDGPLVRALKAGHWVLLDGANLCNPSVLDRLNALCEDGGVLTLNERGAVKGEVETVIPQHNFRLFMSIDTHFGELSRAMRNRGVEISLVRPEAPEDGQRILEFLRLLPCTSSTTPESSALARYSALINRGLRVSHPASHRQRVAPAARLLQEDSTSSAVLDLLLSLPESLGNARVYAATYCIAPSNLALSLRFIRSSLPTQMRWSYILKVLESLSDSRIVCVAKRVRSLHNVDLALPSDILQSQPLDIGMTTGSTENASDSTGFTTLLRMFVALKLFNPSNPSRALSATSSNSETRVRENLASVIPVVLAACARICDEVDVIDTSSIILLTTSMRLLDFVQYLYEVGKHSRIDYSAVHVVSQWLTGCMEDLKGSSFEVEAAVKSFADCVALTSGLGLSEIWSSLSKFSVQDVQTSRLAKLDGMTRQLAGAVGGLRRRIFDVMSLSTMERLMSNTEKDEFDRLAQEIQIRLLTVRSNDPEKEEGTAVPRQVQPLYAVAELALIPAASVSQQKPLSETFTRGVEVLLQSAVEDPQCALARLIPYQQVLWRKHAQQECLSSVFDMQRQWLESIWDIPMLRELDGPSILLSPVILDTTMSQCCDVQQSLHGLAAHEDALKRQQDLISIAAASYRSRASQLRFMLHQALAMVACCFRSTFHEVDIANIETATDHPEGHKLPPSTRELVRLLHLSSHAGLSAALHERMPSVVGADTLDEYSYAEIGRSWIGFARMLLDLYVPNNPIDPAALQRCAKEFWGEKSSFYDAQISILSNYVQRTEGTATNGTIQHLQHLAESVTASFAHVASDHVTRTDLRRLHTYWTEIQQFLSQVLPESKVDALLTAALSGDPAAAMRENVLQASITAFCQRLTGVYADFNDVNAPLQFALCAMKLGVRLATASTVFNADQRSSNTVSTLQCAVSFPSVSCAELWRKRAEANAAVGSLSAILIELTSVLFEVRLGGDIHSHVPEVARLYDQAHGLWSIDRLREEERTREAQTLYRRPDGSGEATEAELEEQDFLAIFPQFGDLLDDEEAGRASHPKNKDIDVVRASSALSLHTIHQELFADSHLSLSSTAQLLHAQRRSIVYELLNATTQPLPESLDALSLPFQWCFLSDHLASLHHTPRSTQQLPYDFYFDENVPEITRAVDALRSLSQRLEVVISEWPDQMVLQHLKTRCEAILQLSFHCPVAKVLSALEQLLTNIEDWEMYANRINSLRSEQQAIIALIISWRRLELAAWQDLLERQATTFASATSEWWFRLYDATIHAVLSMDDLTFETDGRASITPFLEQLIPLLDEFIGTSPLGQFHSRLSLVRSMGQFASCLGKHKGDRYAEPLHRVHSVLHNTWKYYTQFGPQVSSSISNQRVVLERDIRGFIKLASWKDVNVHALKQSAQKTHRQLHKIIRKFRDVLRQPVAPLLTRSAVVPSTDALSLMNALPTLPSTPAFVVELPLPPSSQSASHLSNLTTTLRNFAAAVQRRIGPSLSTLNPDSVEELADSIVATSRALSTIQIPANVDAGRKKAAQKSLLVRKRKACSDTMKELKRAGVAAAVKPGVLQQHHSRCWPREQPVLDTERQAPASLAYADDHLHRLFGEMADLRAFLSNHHQDVPTRDLRRATSHAEVLLSFATRARASLVVTLNTFETVEKSFNRLQTVLAYPQVIAGGPEASSVVERSRDTARKLLNALQELVEHLRSVRSRATVVEVPVALLEELESRITSLESAIVSLDDIWDAMRMSTHHILLKHESEMVQSTVSQMLCTSESLKTWLTKAPHLRVFLEPVALWLEDRDIRPCSHTNTHSSALSEGSIIDTLLLIVQNMLASVPTQNAETDDTDERDNYIREDNDIVCRLADQLKLGIIARHLQQYCVEIATASGDELQRSLGRLLPFLEQYIWLVNAHIDNHAKWVKSLCKLNHVLCSVALTIAKDGFCQPTESEEAAGDGDGQETVEGTGLGEGSGSENVSKDIKDESQVEGLQGEDAQKQEKVERAEEGNAIETSEDFGGQMQDVSDGEDEEDGSDSGSEDEESPEERQENLDASDENAIDEKLWGDEKGEDQGEQSDKTDKDHSTKQTGESEMIGKEGEDQRQERTVDKSEPDSADAGDEQKQETVDNQEEAEPNGTDGAPMDETVQDANTLDLPEDMRLEDTQDEADEDLSGDVDDDLMDEDQDFEQNQAEAAAKDDDDDDGNSAGVSDSQDVGGMQEEPTGEHQAEDGADNAVAEADTHAGDGSGTGELSKPADASQPVAAEPMETGNGATGQAGGREGQTESERDKSDESLPNDGPGDAMEGTAEPQPDVESVSGDASGTRLAGAQVQRQASSRDSIPNPHRSLGDALKDVMQQFNDILDATESDQQRPPATDKQDAQQLEYVQEDDTQANMQALGPAQQDEVAKLRDLKLLDDEQALTDLTGPDEMQVDDISLLRPENLASFSADFTTTGLKENVESALTPSEVRSRLPAPSVDPRQELTPVPETVPAPERGELNEAVELAVRDWQARGQPTDEAEGIWRRYESLTHDLSYALCEQLRLILDPTMATRLKGDYRTGKRLNMKKIIPYIASEYTKDKIWLRRTRASQREYQVLIALDDSRSMAESHSVHLAFQTLALVSKALSRLEVGDVAIARFGQSVDILHSFESPFTDQSGAKVVDAFRFDQKATQVLALLETSLVLLEQARERRASSSSTAADLWQLEIIISDGICQDHERLRTVLRKAEEQRVMTVFIVLDSLHSGTTSSPETGLNQNSILSMNQVAYKDVSGRMELTVTRYLDSFPFEYYVVVRDVEALPEVLAGTLKQFFERISEQ